MARGNKISKGWFIFNVVLTIITGGAWLIPLGIYFGAKLLKNR